MLSFIFKNFWYIGRLLVSIGKTNKNSNLGVHVDWAVTEVKEGREGNPSTVHDNRLQTLAAGWTRGMDLTLTGKTGDDRRWDLTS